MSVLDQFQIDGRIAVVTGGAGLLGTRHAKALLEAGAKVALLDRNECLLAEREAEFRPQFGDRIRGVACDVTSRESLEQARETIASAFAEASQKAAVEILVNNAAIDPKFEGDNALANSRLENYSIDQWNLEISVGLTGSLLAIQVFGPGMVERGRGVITNVASDLGIIAPDQRLYKEPGRADDQQKVKPVSYSAIKHGLIGLTKYVATYWADRGVRCNAIAPGGVYNQQPDEFVAKLSELVPMKRMARIDEYEAAILYLCSDASSYMNGAVMILDGGRSIW